MDTTIEKIADLVDGKLVKGTADQPITGFAALEDAQAGDVSFFANEKFKDALSGSNAGVIVTQSDIDYSGASSEAAIIEVKDAAVAFDSIVAEFGLKAPEFVPGIAEGAFVDPSATLNPDKVSILPGAVVLKNATIGNGTLIQAGAVIGENVSIGKNCDIGHNVSIREHCVLGDRVIIHGATVIGGDGFGYEFEQGRHRKVDQLGIVRIENDVEIGSSTTIDRARFGETVIGEGTKIDNQVQIGHNAIIGKHCIIVAQCGISGSAKLGNYVTLGARVGIAGHIEIADQVTVGGKSGVISSITEPGGTYFGYPAKPMKESLKTKMQIKKLGSLLSRVKDLEKRLEALDEG